MIGKKDRSLLTKNKAFVVPNFDDEAEMLGWAGISFGEEETYKLGKSIKRLATMSGADGVRFGGKIYGTKSDYWIAYGNLKESEEKPDADCEARGEGVNMLVFWVTDNLLNDWTQLPDCKPEHIEQARKIKHVFSGDLNGTVDSNPTFRGKERHLLRATLARIFSATAIVPKGLYEMAEEEEGKLPEMKFAEEAPPMGTEELKSLEAWCNIYPIILKCGRTTHLKPTGMDEEAAEARLAELMEEDKTEERFRDINAHEKIPEMESAWVTKVTGDTQPYNKQTGEGTQTYAVNVIKSLRWPGSITVAKSGKFCTVYVGWGLKKGDPSYQPIEPPEVQADPDDQAEMPEPNPLEAPVEPLEIDTDADEKGSGDEDDE